MNGSATLKIVKMSGSGNDFILVDNRLQTYSDTAMIRLTRLLCRRGLSVGADGLIFIGPSDRYDFKWRFFNADGSEAEMCGNGGRCAARFAQMLGLAGEEMTFETIAGPIQARVAGRVVKLQLTPPRDLRLDQEVPGGALPYKVDFINTGVPHAVLWVDDPEQVDVVGLGAAIRFHPAFQPAGTNVDFARLENDRTLTLRTYERGVEAETLACGTGAVASAAIAVLKGKSRSPVPVRTRGGEILVVHLEGQGPDGFAAVFLEGMVTLVFQGEVCSEALE
ncbi:MAG: diaminopimelate epimerase [Desulfobacterota bacterium]|jgi:diaminopimelate epimerase|nr:diaminopimelate epimerase [Thermodesulfobacteriota bacterium]